jgi:hypothetical protein
MYENKSITITANGLTINFTPEAFNTIMGCIALGNKINAIKELRSLATYLGLKECKEFVEALGGYREGQPITPAPAPLSNLHKCKLDLGQYALLDTLARTKESIKDAITTKDEDDRLRKLFSLYEDAAGDYKEEQRRMDRFSVGY